MTTSAQPDAERAAAVLRPMRAQDGPQVLEVYAQGLATGAASFDTAPPDWSGWDGAHLPQPRLVAVDDRDRVLGWAALSPVSDRCAYSGVAEVSVYVAAAARGRGIGRQLLTELARRSEDAGLWTLQAGILDGNAASLAVHQAAGFRVVGRRERLGQLAGRWRDVLLLERRSTVTGT